MNTLLSVVIALLLLSFLFTTLVGLLRVFRPKLLNGRPTYGPLEDVLFQTSDGITLRGWWYEGNHDQPVVLMCHGVGGNRADLNTLASLLAAEGFGLLSFDFRGHGESGGRQTSFGLRESRDVLAAAQYLRDNGHLDQRRFVLYGLSMGGAALCLAIRRLKKVHSVDAVVLDSVYARLAPIFKMSVEPWPAWARAIFLLFAYLVSDYLFQIPALFVNPDRHVAAIGPSPLLVIHSKRDELVPIQHARMLYAAALQPKYYWYLGNSFHADGLLDEPENYRRILRPFFENGVAKNHEVDG